MNPQAPAARLRALRNLTVPSAGAISAGYPAARPPARLGGRRPVLSGTVPGSGRAA